MENDSEIYKYRTKEKYSRMNQKRVTQEKEDKQSKQISISYTVKVDYYEYYDEYYDEYRGIYYLIIPQEYLNDIDKLIKEKNDIFSRGKILRFSRGNNFQFDVVVESTEKDPDNESIVYSYLIPIKEKYRYYSEKLIDEFQVEERNGDLTYERMLEAINEFIEGNCCSKNIEKYILGNSVINGYKEFPKIFNYKRYYFNNIYNFAKFTKYQEQEIYKIFYQEMSTINLKNRDNRILCLIIYSIYQCRKNIGDKILICSSSNSVADSI